MTSASTKPTGKRLRIAVLNRIFKSTGGGAERYSIALVEQLAARHKIHVFAQHIEHQWPGVTYHPVGQAVERPRWINQLWFAFGTWQLTRKGFDVVHSHEMTWHGNVQTVHVQPVRYGLFQGRSGFALAVRWLKVLTSPRLLAYLWLEKCRYAVQPGRQVVAASAPLRDTLAQTFPLAQGMMKVLTPGVNAAPGRATAAQREAARAGLGLPIQGSCILFVGNDYRKKGLPALLQALQKLPNTTQLAVVGNPAHIPEFRAQAASLGVASQVHFLGALPDVTDAYVAATCLAHPTLEDTFAMVVLEAMAHGVPVVVSGVQYCGIAGLLKNGDNALILDSPTDAAHLAQTLERLLADASLNQHIADGGHRFARERLWSQVALEQEEIYFSSIVGP
ncbi:MAG: glycosyltransferase family 4 protein [Rhodoferax sp.]|nr:glycosyltransferase family 4 protein [Rhodoferax sp.]